jgi:glycerol kinase
LACGVWRGAGDLEALWRAERCFLPTLEPARAAALMQQWEHAVRQAALE